VLRVSAALVLLFARVFQPITHLCAPLLPWLGPKLSRVFTAQEAQPAA
jgi:hypothetical protein